MALGPVVGEAYALPLAAENVAIEREIERLGRQRQTIAASNDTSTAVPQRFRQAVLAARARLSAAEAAYTLADQQARLRIRQANPSEALQKVWYEEGTIAAHNERELAKAALVEAELTLGRQVEARREYEALEAAAPGERAEALRTYQQTIAQIDIKLAAARMRCATE